MLYEQIGGLLSDCCDCCINTDKQLVILYLVIYLSLVESLSLCSLFTLKPPLLPNPLDDYNIVIVDVQLLTLESQIQFLSRHVLCHVDTIQPIRHLGLASPEILVID